MRRHSILRDRDRRRIPLRLQCGLGHWRWFYWNMTKRRMTRWSMRSRRMMNGCFRRSLRVGLGLLLRRNRRCGMGYIFFVVHKCRGFHARCHRRFGGPWRQGWLTSHPAKIGIDDDLAVVAQVHRFELLELLPPL